MKFINELGVDPYEWFDTRFTNPLDSMPVAKDDPLDLAPSSVERQDPPAELMEVPTSVTNPKPPINKKEEKEKTIHEKMYKIATSRYNPFSVGGSENCDSDISCNIGGSESASRF